MEAIDEKVKFIKQVPVYPRDRLRKKTIKVEDIQVPVNLRDRLKRIDKQLRHPKDRTKNKEDQIARDNVSKLMRVQSAFNPKRNTK